MWGRPVSTAESAPTAIIMELSLILPIYNQYDNLKENFSEIYGSLKREFGLGNFEIVIIDDGSTDRSYELEKVLAKKRGVVLLPRKKNGGKGSALKVAIPRCRGRVMGFIDPDLAVPMRYVKPAVDKVLEGHDVVVGSKYVAGAKHSRKLHRLIISRGSNLIVKLVLGSKVTDLTCGLKFWSSSYIKKHLHELKDDRWFFDGELVIMAERHGVVPYEIPVEWKESERSTFKARYILGFLWAVFEMRLRLWRS